MTTPESPGFERNFTQEIINITSHFENILDKLTNQLKQEQDKDVRKTLLARIRDAKAEKKAALEAISHRGNTPAYVFNNCTINGINTGPGSLVMGSGETRGSSGGGGIGITGDRTEANPKEGTDNSPKQKPEDSTERRKLPPVPEELKPALKSLKELMDSEDRKKIFTSSSSTEEQKIKNTADPAQKAAAIAKIQTELHKIDNIILPFKNANPNLELPFEIILRDEYIRLIIEYQRETDSTKQQSISHRLIQIQEQLKNIEYEPSEDPNQPPVPVPARPEQQAPPQQPSVLPRPQSSSTAQKDPIIQLPTDNGSDPQQIDPSGAGETEDQQIKQDLNNMIHRILIETQPDYRINQYTLYLIFCKKNNLPTKTLAELYADDIIKKKGDLNHFISKLKHHPSETQHLNNLRNEISNSFLMLTRICDFRGYEGDTNIEELIVVIDQSIELLHDHNYQRLSFLISESIKTWSQFTNKLEDPDSTGTLTFHRIMLMIRINIRDSLTEDDSEKMFQSLVYIKEHYVDKLTIHDSINKEIFVKHIARGCRRYFDMNKKDKDKLNKLKAIVNDFITIIARNSTDDSLKSELTKLSSEIDDELAKL